MPIGSSALAGSVTVDLLAKTSAFEKSFAKARGTLDAFNDKVQRNAASFRKAGTVMTAVGASIIGSLGLTVNSAAKLGDELDKMGLRTGETAETLSSLGFAAERSGSNIQVVEASIRRAQKGMADAALGIGTAKIAFEELGIEITKSDGSLKKGSELLLEFADKTENMTDASKKAALAQDIFGRSGTQLLPLFADGAKGIKALQKEAVKYGAVISDIEADEGAKFTDSFFNLTTAVKGIIKQIGFTLLPVLGKFADKLSNLTARVINFVDENKELTRIIVFAVGALGALLTVLGPLVFIFPQMVAGTVLLTKAIGGFAVFFKSTLTGLAAFATLKMAVITGGLSVAVVLIIKYWDEVRAAVMATWEQIAQSAVWLWGHLSRGFESIGVIIKHVAILIIDVFKLASKGVGVAFDIINDKAIFVWNQISDGATWLWDKLKQGLQFLVINIFKPAWEFIAELAQTVWGGIVDGFRWLLEKMGIEIPAIGSMFSVTFNAIGRKANAIFSQVASDNESSMGFIGQVWDNSKQRWAALNEDLKAINSRTTEKGKTEWVSWKDSYNRNLDNIKNKTVEINEAVSASTQATASTMVIATETASQAMVSNIKTSAEESGKAVIDSVISGNIGKAITSLGGGFKKVASTIKTDIKTNLVNSILETIKSSAFGQALSALGSKIFNALKSKLSGIGSMITGLLKRALGAKVAAQAAANAAPAAGTAAGKPGVLSAIGAVATNPITLGILAAVGIGAGIKKLFGGENNVFSGEQESVGHFILLKMLGLKPPGSDGTDQNAVPYYRSVKNRKLKNGMTVAQVYHPIWQPFIEMLVKGDLNGAVSFAKGQMEAVGAYKVGFKGDDAVDTSSSSPPSRSSTPNVPSQSGNQSRNQTTIPSISDAVDQFTRNTPGVNSRNTPFPNGNAPNTTVNNIRVEVRDNNINENVDRDEIANEVAQKILESVTNQEAVSY